MAINTRPDQYVIGKGRFYFAPFLTSGALDAYRFIGNVPSFTLTPSQDTLEHSSSTGGINVQDRNIVIGQSLDLAFSTDNMSDENKGLWLGGSLDALTNTALTGQTASLTIKKGYVYALGVTTANPAGAKDITVTATSPTLVAGTDYVVNSRMGTITFPTTGAAVDGTTYTVTYNVAASTRTQVNTRNNVVTGAIRFQSDNPNTGLGKLDYEYFLPYVRLAADGDWGLIGDDWQSFGFAGSVLQQYDAVGNAIPQVTITPITPPT